MSALGVILVALATWFVINAAAYPARLWLQRRFDVRSVRLWLAQTPRSYDQLRAVTYLPRVRLNRALMALRAEGVLMTAHAYGGGPSELVYRLRDRPLPCVGLDTEAGT